MEKNRLEAFSDGVIAIIITIMVLELKTPFGDNPSVLNPLIPILLSYMLSFIHIGIYWNNHHHMFQVVKRVNGAVLWANLHLLFWLSLVPFVTGWMGENHFSKFPVALYGFILLMSALAYTVLSHTLIKHHGKDSVIATAFGKDFKGKISLGLYISAVILAFVSSWISLSFYVIVAAIWIVPDRRIEKVL